jgi:hypothetical protein
VKASERYALAEATGGGLLLDLISGSVLELNESADFAWKNHLAGLPMAAIVNAYAQRYSLDDPTAQAHVVAALDLSLPSGSTLESDFRYERAAGGYRVLALQQAVFELDAAGDWIRLVPNVDVAPDRLRYLLRALAPKLLGLRGQTVLHASAVELNDGLVAFSGLSGSGKTTTARAFADAGARLVCEDRVLLRLSESEIEVPTGSEQAITEWVHHCADELSTRHQAPCGGLDRVSDGVSLPLREIGFLDLRRRFGNRYAVTPLTPVGAAGAVFRNTFYGSDMPGDWMRLLNVAAVIGMRIRGSDLVLPDGLDRLRNVAQLLTAAGTLRCE